GEGETADWQIEKTGDKAKNVLQIKSPANKPTTLNLCINEDVTVSGNNILSLRIKAVGGEKAQAGGVVWNYQNNKNFYMAILDFQKNEVAVYKVADGKMEKLGSAPYKMKKDHWEEMHADQTNGRIIVRMVGVSQPVLMDPKVRDKAFTKGRVGVVT